MSAVSIVAGGQPSKQLQIHLTPEAGAEKQPANLSFPGSPTKPRGIIFTQVCAEVTSVRETLHQWLAEKQKTSSTKAVESAGSKIQMPSVQCLR